MIVALAEQIRSGYTQPELPRGPTFPQMGDNALFFKGK